MKTPTPIETIRNAYGPQGEAVAEVVITLIAQGAHIISNLKECAAGDPLRGILAAHITEEMTKANAKVIGDLLNALLHPSDVGGFLGACHAEANRREEASNKVAACLKELMP